MIGLPALPPPPCPRQNKKAIVLVRKTFFSFFFFFGVPFERSHAGLQHEDDGPAAPMGPVDVDGFSHPSPGCGDSFGGKAPSLAGS